MADVLIGACDCDRKGQPLAQGCGADAWVVIRIGAEGRNAEECERSLQIV
jgi:hypothetical protein